MPRSPDLAIFVLTTDDRQTDRQTTDKTDHITPCACARGNDTAAATPTGESGMLSTIGSMSPFSLGFWQSFHEFGVQCSSRT